MKRLFMVASVFVMGALALSAETVMSENSEAAVPEENVKEFNISSASTEMSMLEEKNALMAAPADKEDKDVAYWAQSVLSRIKVMGYAQAGYTATFQENGRNTNTFDMKRVVMMLGADIAPHFYAFIMHEFKAGNLLEYYMEYRPSKAINFRLGQSKTEISMTNPLSPRIFESINCAPMGISWLCGSDPLMSNGSGRDMGLMMYGDLFNNHLRYVIEVVNGGQINKNDQNNQKNIIAKLEYKPVKNFRVSVSGQKGYGCAVTESAYNDVVRMQKVTEAGIETLAPVTYHIAKGETYRQDRYAVGCEWMSSIKGNDYFKNRCTVVRCEAIGGRDGECHSFGAYASLTQPVYKGMDVVAQVDYFNRNTDMKYKQTDLLLGVQYWMHSKCRVQAQYNYSILSDEMKAVACVPGNYGKFMAQVQFSF